MEVLVTGLGSFPAVGGGSAARRPNISVTKKITGCVNQSCYSCVIPVSMRVSASMRMLLLGGIVGMILVTTTGLVVQPVTFRVRRQPR
jgi:hypothetical protein